MKKILGILVLMLPMVVRAQTTLNVTAIAGRYNMRDIKDVLQSHATRLGSGGTVSQSVSGGVIIELELTSRAYKNVFGGYMDYAETRGAITDQSNQSVKMKVSRFSFGFTDYYDLGLGFGAGAKLGLCYSALNDQFAFPGVIPQKYYSLGFLVQPGIVWNSRPAPVMIHALLGYELNAQGRTTYTDNNTQFLVTNPDNEAHINWSGLRAGVGVGFRL